MNYQINFHGPFRIATGRTADGLDMTIDAKNQLPASSLKGAMRNAATNLLGQKEHPLLTAVFGKEGTGSPWSWTSGHFATAPTRTVRARIAIGDDGVVEDQALMRGEQLEAETATFSVDMLEHVPEEAVADHHLLLNASAAAISSIGGDRNRGFGWVTIKPLDQPMNGRDLATGIIDFRKRVAA